MKDYNSETNKQNIPYFLTKGDGKIQEADQMFNLTVFLLLKYIHVYKSSGCFYTLSHFTRLLTPNIS